LKILHVVGNRPQFIKLAVLYKELAQREGISQQIIHTGQHASEQMSEVFFRELAIPVPDVFLKPQSDQTPDQFIGETAAALHATFLKYPEHIVIVYGDTNTTHAAAIAARRTELTLVHFEAGIRTGDHSMPEEINRIIADRLADINYCCTSRNYQAMLAEGFGSSIKNHVVLTGDLMYDAYLHLPAADKNITAETNYIAATIHRAANISSKEKLSNIIEALNHLNEKIPVIMPVHPHTKKRIAEFGIQPAFQLLEPAGYPAMKKFIQEATFVITDSGGTAREAFFARKRSVVVMEKPFWPEIDLEECGARSIAATDSIIAAFHSLPELDPNFQTPIFGEGYAAKNIADDLLAQFP
jgi:UDP-GlcNAc3NAcA epimerase